VFEKRSYVVRRLVRGSGIVLVAAALLAPMTSASGALAPTLRSARVPGYSGALVNRTSHTLYALSSERGAKIKCKGTCLHLWPPLLVKRSVKRISLGVGVKGKIGFVVRSKTMKQVTFNSFPVYTFSGDKGTLKSKGQGIVAFGGTWHLIRAAAATPGATALTKVAKKTTSSGGGGWGG
jgi:predicted lipoprotein with Yx(FWY)xxD motif